MTITSATSLYPLLKYLTNTKEIKNASEETTKALIKNAFTSLNVHKKKEKEGSKKKSSGQAIVIKKIMKLLTGSEILK